MSKLSVNTEALTVAATSSAELVRREMAAICGRFAELLRERFVDDLTPVAIAIKFLEDRYRNAFGPGPTDCYQTGVRERCRQSQGPLGNLARSLDLDDIELKVLLLAGTAEHHEGFADLYRTLHPAREPYPSVGLAAQLFCPTEDDRLLLRERLTNGALLRLGALNCIGDTPIFTRSLCVPGEFWTLLQGRDATVAGLPATTSRTTTAGLAEWFETPICSWALSSISSAKVCTIVVVADDDEIAFHRGLALCLQAGVRYRGMSVTDNATPALLNAIRLQSTALAEVPVIHCRSEQASRPDWPELGQLDGPLVLCCQSGRAPRLSSRPAINIPVERLSVRAIRSAWAELLPEIADHTSVLAARYPVEPYQIQRIARDAHFRSTQTRPVSVKLIADTFKNRTASGVSGGVDLVRPVSGWSQLVMPKNPFAQLKDAVERLYQQSTVLDEWRFLADRRGARGVRMLFSGPPGTGKTLSAEVLANALDVDLLVVDLSKVVSKWIGETEKNLAEVFNEAEQIKAVLFFDEADALFGKRTEVADAHDRYANLETAYLLTRLERFDGLAVLATNFRRNLDVAFVRRLDYIVEFREPSVVEREKLWRCHIPKTAPLAENLSLDELARLFPIVGGQIRNAALSGAYFAAQEGTAITREHLIRGIRREYEKAGKAFRELAVT